MIVFKFLLVFKSLTFGLDLDAVDAVKIVSKTPEEIEAVLGKSTKLELFTPNGQRCSCERFYYLNNRISIIYFEGKSDRIFISNSISLLNLDKAKINSVHKWKGFSEIRISRVKECCSSS